MWLIRPTSEGVRAGGQDGLIRRDAIRTIAFWQLGGAIFLAGAGSVGFVSQLQSVAIEFGTPAERSGILLAILALSVMIFRVVAGWSLDRLAPRLTAAAFFIASGLGLMVWLLPHGSMALAVVGTLALGLSVGSEHAFISFFCARLFGMRAYSAIFGALAVFLYFGMAAGGLVFARSRDLSGSYSIAIVAATIGLVVAGLLLAALPARVKAEAQ